MKILYIIDRIEVRGGTERHLFDLIEGLSKLNFYISLVVLYGGEYLDEFRKIKNVDILSLCVEKIYNIEGLLGLGKIIDLLNENKFDIIQTFHSASDILGPLSALLSFKNSVVISSRRDMGYTKSPRILILQKILNRRVDHILANSEEVKKAVIENEKFNKKKISVVYNGIDFKKLNVENSILEMFKKKYCQPTYKIIGSVGNIRPVKGYDELIDAAHILLSTDKNVRFLVAGKGATQEMEAKLKTLNMDEHFFFIGSIGSNDIRSFLEILDIYVQPSRSEGFSNSVLEAMSCGLPVVVTDIGGNIELVNDHSDGIRVAPCCPLSLAEGIRFYLENPDKMLEYGQRAKVKVLSRFSFHEMLRNYTQIYCDLKQKKYEKNYLALR